MSASPIDAASTTEPRADRQLVRWLLGWVTPYLGRVALAAALVTAGSVLQVAGPLLTAAAIDLYLRPQATAEATKVLAVLDFLGLPSQGDAGLVTLALMYLASLVLSAVLLTLQARTMLMTGQLVMRDMRSTLFARLQKLDLAWFNKTPAGRVITRLTSDVEAVNELFTSGLVDILSDIVLLSGIVVVLFGLDWRLAAVAFSVLPLMALLSMWFRRHAREIYREVRGRLAALNTHLQEHLAGITTIQLARAEHRVAETFRSLDAAHRDANIRGIHYYAVFYPLVELLTAAGLASLIVFGGKWTLEGTLSLGVLVAFVQYVQRFYRPISDLAENFNVLQASLAASERLRGLLATEARISDPTAPAPAPPRRRTLSFDGVTFSYDADGPKVLHDVSFTVASGERVAIVGHTGAGKTTLVNLLLRFYDIQEGVVAVDGVDVRLWELATLRSRFAVVLQEVDCFAGTLRDNISLGRSGVDDAKIRWALEQVQAGVLLSRLPNGLDSLLGERGVGLSAGERQLVSFARALVGDPDFLILDEATAAVDAVTENAIQHALERLLANRTAIVIAHRLATVTGCDRVLVMRAGEVVEHGTHEELLALRGFYRTLYDLQLLGLGEASAAAV